MYSTIPHHNELHLLEGLAKINYQGCGTLPIWAPPQGPSTPPLRAIPNPLVQHRQQTSNKNPLVVLCLPFHSTALGALGQSHRVAKVGGDVGYQERTWWCWRSLAIFPPTPHGEAWRSFHGIHLRGPTEASDGNPPLQVRSGLVRNRHLSQGFRTEWRQGFFFLLLIKIFPGFSWSCTSWPTCQCWNHPPNFTFYPGSFSSIIFRCSEQSAGKSLTSRQ